MMAGMDIVFEWVTIMAHNLDIINVRVTMLLLCYV